MEPQYPSQPLIHLTPALRWADVPHAQSLASGGLSLAGQRTVPSSVQPTVWDRLLWCWVAVREELEMNPAPTQASGVSGLSLGSPPALSPPAPSSVAAMAQPRAFVTTQEAPPELSWRRHPRLPQALGLHLGGGLPQ